MKTMAGKRFWLGILVLVLAFGITVVGCDTGSTDDTNGTQDSRGNNPGGNNSGGNEPGGNTPGENNPGGNEPGGNEPGGNQEVTFTPPTKAQLEAFVENYRTTKTIMSNSAAVYVRSVAINTYTVNGNNITTNPSPVPESAQVQVRFTVRTILIFDNLSLGERMQIDNFRTFLLAELRTWLKNQGFQYSNTNVTTGNTIYG